MAIFESLFKSHALPASFLFPFELPAATPRRVPGIVYTLCLALGITTGTARQVNCAGRFGESIY
jgi:hypothetical protein